MSLRRLTKCKALALVYFTSDLTTAIVSTTKLKGDVVEKANVTMVINRKVEPAEIIALDDDRAVLVKVQDNYVKSLEKANTATSTQREATPPPEKRMKKSAPTQKSLPAPKHTQKPKQKKPATKKPAPVQKPSHKKDQPTIMFSYSPPATVPYAPVQSSATTLPSKPVQSSATPLPSEPVQLSATTLLSTPVPWSATLSPEPLNFPQNVSFTPPRPDVFTFSPTVLCTTTSTQTDSAISDCTLADIQSTLQRLGTDLSTVLERITRIETQRHLCQNTDRYPPSEPSPSSISSSPKTPDPLPVPTPPMMRRPSALLSPNFLDLKRKECPTPTHFATQLARRLFSKQELLECNCAGIGRTAFNKDILDLIKSKVFTCFPKPASEQHIIWRNCRKAIDSMARYVRSHHARCADSQ